MKSYFDTFLFATLRVLFQDGIINEYCKENFEKLKSKVWDEVYKMEKEELEKEKK